MLGLYYESVLIGLGINILLAMGFYFTFITGQFSVAHGCFMGIGAYIASILTVKFGIPLVFAIPAAGASAMVIGLLLGLPVLRLHRLYLVMATLGFGEIVRTFFSTQEYVGGVAGFRGMTGTTLGMVWASVLVSLGFLWLHARSRIGLAYYAVRKDEDVAQAMGINIRIVKVGAFGIGAAITGIGGALYAHHFCFIEPARFGASMSLTIILFVCLGGTETYWGPILGATILTLLPEVFRFIREWYLFMYGLIFIVLMIFRPKGIMGKETMPAFYGAVLWLFRRIIFRGEQVNKARNS